MKTSFSFAFILTAMFAALALSASGCSHGQCSNVPQRPLASENPSASPAPSTANTAADTGNVSGAPQASIETKPASAPKDAVQVFKPTGELQCEPGKGTALEAVQSQLTAKKITVYESHTQPDGLMHVAVCGSPTGTIHVFSIPKKSLKQAAKLGFKEFKPKK